MLRLTRLGGLLIIVSFCAIWWLGHPLIRIIALYFWFIAQDLLKKKDREISKQIWMQVADLDLWTLPYTATVCTLAWIGLSLTEHNYVDMPGPFSEETFFGTIAYGVGAWSVIILLRAFYQLFRREQSAGK